MTRSRHKTAGAPEETDRPSAISPLIGYAMVSMLPDHAKASLSTFARPPRCHCSPAQLRIEQARESPPGRVDAQSGPARLAPVSARFSRRLLRRLLAFAVPSLSPDDSSPGRRPPRSRAPQPRGRRAFLVKTLLSLALLAAPDGAILAFENISEARLISMPEMPVPDYLEPTVDPVFGTPFVRVTDPAREILPGISCRPEYCRHRYSSTQAWNADQSLLVIHKGCPGLCFLDGQSYDPLFQRRPEGTCEWHPADPARMICVGEREIYSWHPRSNERTLLYAPGGYGNLLFGPGKNNLSRDGHRLVVRARDRSGAEVAFAYDIEAAKKYPDIPLARLSGSNSYCTISPTGQYVFCYQKMPDGTYTSYVLTVDGEQVQHWPEDHRPGHGDMAIDSDGTDVYVGISKSEPDKYHVIKRRLADGAVTVLTPRGPASHASVRNIDRPNWVFLTYSGSYHRASTHPGTLPLYQEIVALRTDGSGEMRRIVHTRSAKHDYLSEAHASPSPDGSQVIWASNWGRPGGPVASYVARISWP